jgi:hypothetical protein
MQGVRRAARRPSRRGRDRGHAPPKCSHRAPGPAMPLSPTTPARRCAPRPMRAAALRSRPRRRAASRARQRPRARALAAAGSAAPARAPSAGIPAHLTASAAHAWAQPCWPSATAAPRMLPPLPQLRLWRLAPQAASARRLERAMAAAAARLAGRARAVRTRRMATRGPAPPFSSVAGSRWPPHCSTASCRRLAAPMQARPGPARVKPYGWLQTNPPGRRTCALAVAAPRAARARAAQQRCRRARPVRPDPSCSQPRASPQAGGPRNGRGHR